MASDPRLGTRGSAGCGNPRGRDGSPATRGPHLGAISASTTLILPLRRVVNVSVAEDVETQNVDFAPRIAEEGGEAIDDASVWSLSDSTSCGPIGVRDHEKQVLGIWRDVGFPQIFQVMVVVDGSSPLHLREDPPVSGKAIEEVRARPGDEPVVRGENYLFTETELSRQQIGNDGLDRATLSSVDMRYANSLIAGFQVYCQLTRQLIYQNHLAGFIRRQVSTSEPCALDRHGRQLHSWTVRKLVQRRHPNGGTPNIDLNSAAGISPEHPDRRRGPTRSSRCRKAA